MSEREKIHPAVIADLILRRKWSAVVFGIGWNYCLRRVRSSLVAAGHVRAVAHLNAYVNERDVEAAHAEAVREDSCRSGS